MDLLASSIPTVVIGLATAILALSLLVQVLQELWKFLSSSRATCYTKVLEDFLGPWATRMARPGVLPEFQARGPFQFRRLGPTGVLLPLGKADLVEGLERTAPPATHRALRAIRAEADLQAGKAGKPSGEWKRFVSDLDASERESAEVAAPDAWEIRGLREFLTTNELLPAPDSDATIDAALALRAFRTRFLDHVVDAERHFDRLQELFQFRWRRRNMRQTFIFGTLIAFFAAQPIDRIYQRAETLSATETIQLAEGIVDLYEAQQEVLAQETERTGTPPPLTRAQIDSALTISLAALDDTEMSEFNGWRAFWGPDAQGNPIRWDTRVWYLLGSLMTAVLISFGAPFWNDLLGTLIRMRRGTPSSATPPPAPEGPSHA